jgi:hypothetical protein
MQDGQPATAVEEAVVVSMEEVLAVAVFTAAVLVVDSTEEASAAALSTALAFGVAVSVGGTGVATGAITDSLMMSSSAATVIRGGGTGIIRTGITVMTITRTATMDTGRTHIATTDTVDTVTMVGPVMDTAMAADQGISGVCGVGDKPTTAL